ncbi:replicase [Shuangao alphatetra-like virus 1]|uniref:replicase n=1 Tax=Shuangao alphatetra-like virus 1 TaxID=1923464 RepID=UPI00090AD5AF|nr:replicase [Shuangao alphatetra-like virus 1]APG77637.1 replicase [Shuangao alphatetra-like virus 1]
MDYGQTIFDKQRIAAAENILTTNIINDAVDKSFKPNVTLTAEQHKTVTMWLRTPIYPTQTTYSPHPEMKTLLDFANQSLNATRLRKDIRVLEIGADERIKTVKNLHHVCHYYRGIKDQARHLTYQFMKERTTYHGQLLTDDNTKRCNKGFNKCSVQADMIIGAASTMDLDATQFALGMEKHGALRAKLYMIIPPEITRPEITNLYTPYQLRYYDQKHQIIKINDEQDILQIEYVEMLFANDTSSPYLHRYQSLLSWLKPGTYTDRRNYFIERVAWHGPLVIIDVSAVLDGGRIGAYDIAFDENYIIVPNAAEAIITGRVNHCHSRMFPADIVTRVLTYAESLGQSNFDSAAIASYIRSQQTQISVGKQVIVQRFLLKQNNDFNFMVINLTLIAALRNYKRTTLISMAMEDSREKLQSYRNNDLEIVGDKRIHSIKQDIATYCSVHYTNLKKKLFHNLTKTLNSLMDLGYRKENVPLTFKNVEMWAGDSYLLDQIDVQVFGQRYYTMDFRNQVDDEYGGILHDLNLGFHTVEESSESNEEIDEQPMDDKQLTMRRMLNELLILWEKCTIPNLSEGCVNFMNDHKIRHEQRLKDCDRILQNINITRGVPGSGKSYQALKTSDAKTLFIAPTRALAEEYKNLGKRALTFQIAFTKIETHAKIYNHVILDEAFTMHPGYAIVLGMWFKKVTLIGDPDQIGFIDFDSALSPKHYTMIDLMGMIEPIRITSYNASMRFGNEYATKIGQHFGVNITGDPKKTTNIVYHDSLPDPKTKLEGMTIALSQNTAQLYNINTVHQSQGQNSPIVNIIIPKYDSKLAASQNHMYVALTRASQTTNVYIESGLALEPKYDLRINFKNALERGAQNLYPLPNHETIKAEVVTQPDLAAPKPMVVNTPQAIDQILTKINVPNNGGLRVYTKTKEIEYPVTIKGKFFELRGLDLSNELVMAGDRYSMETRSADKCTALRTLINRYNGRPFHTHYDDSLTKAQLLFANVKHTLFRDDVKFIEGSSILDNQQKEIVNLVSKMLGRGSDKMVTDEIFDKRTWVTSYFLKEQSKVKPGGADGSLTGKAGQGVNATSKTFNAIMGTMARELDNLYRRALNDNVILANGMDELRMYNSLKLNNINYSRGYSIDVKEMDSTYNLIAALYFDLILEHFGINPVLRSVMFQLCITYTINCVLSSMQAYFKLKSGEPCTLIKNSIWAIAQVCDPSVFVGIDSGNVIILHKGDDIGIIGDIKINEAKLTLQNAALGMQLKIDDKTPIEFCGDFITGNGASLDLVRFALKVKSKPLKEKIYFKSDKNIKIVHYNNYSGDKHCIKHSELDYTNYFGILNFFKNLSNDEWHHYLSEGNLTAEQYRILRQMTRVFKIKIILHTDVAANDQAIQERIISVKDRLRKVYDTKSYSEAINNTAVHYNLAPTECEQIYSWLKNIGDSNIKQFRKYYRKEYRPVVFIEENEDEPQHTHQSIYVTLEDYGGDGDCFWRAMGISSTKYGLARNWVDATDAVQVWPEPLAILVIAKSGNYIVANCSDRQPDIALKLDHDGEKAHSGHYYRCLYDKPNSIYKYKYYHNLKEIYQEN